MLKFDLKKCQTWEIKLSIYSNSNDPWNLVYNFDLKSKNHWNVYGVLKCGAACVNGDLLIWVLM